MTGIPYPISKPSTGGWLSSDHGWCEWTSQRMGSKPKAWAPVLGHVLDEGLGMIRQMEHATQLSKIWDFFLSYHTAFGSQNRILEILLRSLSYLIVSGCTPDLRKNYPSVTQCIWFTSLSHLEKGTGRHRCEHAPCMYHTSARRVLECGRSTAKMKCWEIDLSRLETCRCGSVPCTFSEY